MLRAVEGGCGAQGRRGRLRGGSKGRSRLPCPAPCLPCPLCGVLKLTLTGHIEVPNPNPHLTLPLTLTLTRTLTRSGVLKLTLTGHISTIRGLAVSPRSPYLFSAGEDKMVKCWDLEYNRVIRNYHGHLSGDRAGAKRKRKRRLDDGRPPSARVASLKGSGRACAARERSPGHWAAPEGPPPPASKHPQDGVPRCRWLGLGPPGVYCLSLHPTLDLLVTGGRDCVARVWDVRTKNAVHTLCGHQQTVASVETQARCPTAR